MTASDDGGYIKTATHNYVSRKAAVSDPAKVEIKGKSVLREGVSVRSDLAIIRVGRYCYFGQDTCLAPAPLGDKHVPMVVRGNAIIGKECQIHASAIGTNVYIGDGVTIGDRCIIKDSCWIEAGTVLGKDTMIPPFSRVAGAPGKVIETLPASASLELQQFAHQQYQEFCAANRET